MEVIDKSLTPADLTWDATQKLAGTLWQPEQIADLAEPPKLQVSVVVSFFCPGPFMADLAVDVAAGTAPPVDAFLAACPTA